MFRRRQKSELAAALVETLATMRAEMIGLRAIVSGEICDLRSIAQHLAAQGVAVEHLLVDADIFEKGAVEEIKFLCISEADQRVAGWRSPAAQAEGGE